MKATAQHAYFGHLLPKNLFFEIQLGFGNTFNRYVCRMQMLCNFRLGYDNREYEKKT